MSETIDLTMLAGTLQEVQRDMRLPRVQLEQLAGTAPARLDSIDARLGVMEKIVHSLATEITRDFGQVQQGLTRHERRFDTLDAGLTSLRESAADNTQQLEEVLRLLRNVGSSA
jgi:hypothetical protein